MDDPNIDVIAELLRRFERGEWPNVIVHSDPDWVMWLLTFVGIAITAVIAWLTFRANVRADASRKVADAAAVLASKALTEAMNVQQKTTEAHIEALRAIADGMNGGNGAAAPATDVRWELARDIGRGRWLIRNVGTATAHDVKVEGLTEQDATDLHVFESAIPDVQPNSVVMFSIERSLASPPVTAVAVNWTDDLGQARVWHVAVA